jgi:hypothetical protein
MLAAMVQYSFTHVMGYGAGMGSYTAGPAEPVTDLKPRSQSFTEEPPLLTRFFAGLSKCSS